MRFRVAAVAVLLAAASAASKAQTPELKFIADTVVVQAEGTSEADPDLATMTSSRRTRNSRRPTMPPHNPCSKYRRWLQTTA
jgi:uncharacterized protein YggE